MQVEVDVRYRFNPPLYRIRMACLPPRATKKIDAEAWETACMAVYEELVRSRYRAVYPAVVFVFWHTSGQARDPDQIDLREVINRLIQWGVVRNDTFDHILAVVTGSRHRAGEDETEIWITTPKNAPETLGILLDMPPR